MGSLETERLLLRQFRESDLDSYADICADSEVAWTLGRHYWGRGYATEGGRAALEYAFTQLDQPHVISLIHPDNTPSIRVAERIGERLERMLGADVCVYGIHRDQGAERPPGRTMKPDQPLDPDCAV
jgi:RimJ/RimL family protein N-acetyltransferase